MKISEAHVQTSIIEPIWHFFKYAKCVSWMWSNVGRQELELKGDEIVIRWPSPPPEGILVTLTYEFEY